MSKDDLQGGRGRDKVLLSKVLMSQDELWRVGFMA